eukprot:2473815-Pyramimonas_sp.AAC.1
MSSGKRISIDEDAEVGHHRETPGLKDRSQSASRRVLAGGAWITWKDYWDELAPPGLGGGGDGVLQSSPRLSSHAPRAQAVLAEAVAAVVNAERAGSPDRGLRTQIETIYCQLTG